MFCFNNRFMIAQGFSYLEMVIALSLVCVFASTLTNSFKVISNRHKSYRENLYADIASENILNLTEYALDNKYTQSQLEEMLKLKENQDAYYHDKFAFIIRVNKINQEGLLNPMPEININHGAMNSKSNLKSIDTQITCVHNQNQKEIISDANLITIDLYNKQNIFLKRAFLISCYD